MKKILVIGAQNIDLFARSGFDYQLHDSNISQINLNFGGVAGNIATNLSLLGNDIHLLTVFGDDHFGGLAKQNLKKLNIDFNESRTIENVGNSIYLGIMDKSNDLFLGLNDMEIVKYLNVPFFESKINYIQGFDILIIDNNLNQEALEHLHTTYRQKTIIMDAVSAAKAAKLKHLLSNINLLKLNKLELEALTDDADVSERLSNLLDQGVGAVILTDSEKELVFISKDKYIATMPIPLETIANTTGAGDAFLSGFIHSMLKDKSDEECLETAKQIAYKCLTSVSSTINKSE